jgi:hypothetical protein
MRIMSALSLQLEKKLHASELAGFFTNYLKEGKF